MRERYGVDPKQAPDVIALRGGSADRIPGVAGVGAVGAASLLQRYGTLKKMLAAGWFAAQKDKLLLYKSIATMDKSAPLPPLRNQKPSWDEAAKLARSWNLKKLAERLAALARS